MSTDPDSRGGFGPYLAGVGPTYRDGDTDHTIRYGEIEDVKRALELHGKVVAAFLIEPIQGEAGIVIPPTGYLRQVRELCSQHNVLLICDEIQTVRCTSLPIKGLTRICVRTGPFEDRQVTVCRARRHPPGHCPSRQSSVWGCVSRIRRPRR
jgi:Aminotransferase class-III